MTTISPRGRSTRRRILGALALTAVMTTVVTVGIRPTFASWVMRANLGDSLGVASSTCTTPGVYRTTSTSRFLAGSVAGVPLSTSGALASLAANNGAGTTVFPSGATSQGANAATTTVSSTAATAAVAALTPTGTQTQYASATSTGTSSAAAGAVTAAGGIDTTAIANGTVPTVGGVDVSSVLAGVSGGTSAAGPLSRLRLTTGAVGATATLNECARRWGASLSSALSRSTKLTALSLTARESAVNDLLAAVADRGTISTAVGTVTAGSATSTAETQIGTAAGTDLVSALRAALGGALGYLVGTPTATVAVTSDFGAVSTIAQRTVSAPSAAVKLDGSNGDLLIDLGSIAGTTTPSANTNLFSSATTGTIASGISGASAALVDSVDTAWDTALAGTSIRVDLSLQLGQIGTVTASLTGNAASFASGTESVSGPVLTLAAAPSLPLGLDLSAVTSLVQGISPALLTTSARSPVTTQVINPLTDAVSATKLALGNSLTTAQSLITSQLASLPNVLSITLNEQPDVTPFPTPVAGMGTGYLVTAMRVKVFGGAALDLAVDSTSVGPDTTINQ